MCHILINNPEQTGGPGCIVKIDESFFSKTKHEVGRLVPQQWIFGGNIFLEKYFIFK